MKTKELLRYLQQFPRHLADSRKVQQLKDGDYRVENVPYVCQFPSLELVADELEGRLAVHSDSNWRQFGFKDSAEIDYWVPRLCGIACVKMLIEYAGRQESMAELTKAGVELGGYDVEGDVGWYYKPLVKLLSMYGIVAQTVSHLSIYSVARAVHDGLLVIASVNPQIIRGDSKIDSYQKSGHLVVVVGVRIKKGSIEGFYINNPSGKTKDMQCYAFITLATFQASYGQRGIAAKVVHD